MRFFLASSFGTVASDFRERFPEFGPGTPVAFIANAADPYPERPWIDSDRAALLALGFDVRDFDLRVTRGEALDAALAASPIVFMAGGNVAYLAGVLHATGAFGRIRERIAAGAVYVGSSAGSILAGPATEPFFEEDELDCRAVGTTLTAELAKAGATDEDARKGGFGFVPYAILPHENGPVQREDHARLREKYRGACEFRSLSDREFESRP